MQRLLTDDDLHAELSEKGLQRARVFSWQRAAQRTLEVYRTVVQARPIRSSPSTTKTTPEQGL